MSEMFLEAALQVAEISRDTGLYEISSCQGEIVPKKVFSRVKNEIRVKSLFPSQDRERASGKSVHE